MGTSHYRPIEELDVFMTLEGVSDSVWAEVVNWPNLAKDTIGKQIISAADSIGANLVEGDGRGSDIDSIRFFRYARASAREARLWIIRAVKRGLIQSEVGEVLIRELEKGVLLLNNLIKYRRESQNRQVREMVVSYALNPLEAVD
jgi:four helix bundle protein